MQIILGFKSRLHTVYSTRFFSIIQWLIFTLFYHISFHRNKIYNPLHLINIDGCFQASTRGEGCRRTIVRIVLVEATITGSGTIRKENNWCPTHTCMHIAYWPYLFIYYFLNLGHWPQRANTHIQTANICKCVFSVIKAHLTYTASFRDQNMALTHRIKCI